MDSPNRGNRRRFAPGDAELLNNLKPFPDNVPSSFIRPDEIGSDSNIKPDDICSGDPDGEQQQQGTTLKIGSPNFFKCIIEEFKNDNIGRYKYSPTAIDNELYERLPHKLRTLTTKRNHVRITLNLVFIEVVQGGQRVGFRYQFNNEEESVHDTILNKVCFENDRTSIFKSEYSTMNKRHELKYYGDGYNVELMHTIIFQDSPCVMGRVYRGNITGMGSVLLYYDTDLDCYNNNAADYIMNSPSATKLSNICGAYKNSLMTASSDMMDTSEEKSGTMEFAVMKCQDILSKKKKKKPSFKKTTTAETILPKSFGSRRKDRFDSDNIADETKGGLSSACVDTRLGSVVSRIVNISGGDGTKVKINTKQDKDGSFTNKTLHAILPLTDESSSYVTVDTDNNGKSADDYWAADVPQVYYKQQSYPITLFERKLCKYTKPDINEHVYCPVLLDKNNELGRGRRQIFLLIANHCDSDRLERVSKLCEDIGDWNSFPAFVQVLCAIDIYQGSDSVEETDSKITAIEELNAEQMKELMEHVEVFITTCFEGLVRSLDFEKGNLCELVRIPWFLWNLMAWEFYSYVDPVMQERMRKLMVLMWKRIIEIYPDLEEGCDEFVTKFKEETEKAKMFHYAVIMAVSGSKMDEKCRQCYEKLMYMKYDSRSLLEDIGRLDGFPMFFDCLVEVLRTFSLAGSGAMSVVNLAISCCVDYGGDIPPRDVLLAIEQISHKKERITNNTKVMTSGDLNDFGNIGVDVHVERVIGIIIKLWIRSKFGRDITDSASKKYAHIIADMISKEVGVYANEIIGQLSQYINEGRSEILENVFQKVVEKERLFSHVIEEWRKSAKRK